MSKLRVGLPGSLAAERQLLVSRAFQGPERKANACSRRVATIDGGVDAEFKRRYATREIRERLGPGLERPGYNQKAAPRRETHTKATSHQSGK
jgi:hypothetical protein